MFLTFFDLISKRYFVRLPLKLRLHLDVKITFLLEEVDEVTLAFIHQVAINCAFFINRDQFFLASAGNKRNNRKARAIHAQQDYRSGLNVDSQVSPIRFRVILRRQHFDLARQTVLIREMSFQQARGRFDSRRRIGSTSF